MNSQPKFPLLTYTLAFSIILAALVDAVIRADLIALAAINPTTITHGEIYRLFTYMFFHVGVLHIAVNVVLLFLIGIWLENKIGKRTFILLYFAGGLTGALLHLFFDILPGIGASGAIYALLGANITLLQTQREPTRLERSYLYLLIALAGAGIIAGILLEMPAFRLPIHAGNWVHVGGLFTGVIVGIILKRKRLTSELSP